MTKKKYVLIGASNRGLYMFAKPMVEELQHCAEIVGIFDPNPLRMEFVKKDAGLSCPSYTDFDKMIAETKPDSEHNHYRRQVSPRLYNKMPGSRD